MLALYQTDTRQIKAMGVKTKTSYVVSWRNGSTRTIRVPEKLAKDFMRLARAIDANENINIEDLIDLVSENKLDTRQAN